MPAGDASRLGQTLFDDVVERLVKPELERRVAAGAWNADDRVFAFQVLFRDNATPEVRLNADIGGMLKVAAARGDRSWRGGGS